MYDLSNEHVSIWKSLKSGSLGTVLWSLRRDRKVILGFSEALYSSNDPHDLAASLEYPAFVSSNCIGQVALHQLAADDSSRFHVEPRDPRWALFKALRPSLLADLCDCIVIYPSFRLQLEKSLQSALRKIRSGSLSGLEALETDPDLLELQRQFLVLLGTGFGHALEQEGKTLPSLLGDITKLNESSDAPHYSFRKRHRIAPENGGDTWWS